MSKIEGLVNTPPAPRRRVFKVTVSYSYDRNRVMGDILQFDDDAEFRICGDWSFKVKTKLTLNDLHRIMIRTGRISNARKAWFF